MSRFAASVVARSNSASAARLRLQLPPTIGDGQRPPADVLVMREEALREIELSVEIRWVWKR